MADDDADIASEAPAPAPIRNNILPSDCYTLRNVKGILNTNMISSHYFNNSHN